MSVGVCVRGREREAKRERRGERERETENERGGEREGAAKLKEAKKPATILLLFGLKEQRRTGGFPPLCGTLSVV